MEDLEKPIGCSRVDEWDLLSNSTPRNGAEVKGPFVTIMLSGLRAAVLGEWLAL